LQDWPPARTYAEETARTQAHPRGRVHRFDTPMTEGFWGRDGGRASVNAVQALDAAPVMESHQLRDRPQRRCGGP
jgi:hypothetical protein